ASASQTQESSASEEKDEEVELIVVPFAIKILEEKDESRTSSTTSKTEEILTEPQKEMKDSSIDRNGYSKRKPKATKPSTGWKRPSQVKV
ncbi:hypothetical protein Tco_0395488, partial [Tanacetum coccineum]